MVEIAGGIILALLLVVLLPRILAGAFVIAVLVVGVVAWLAVTWIIAELSPFEFWNVGFWTGIFALAVAFEYSGGNKKK